MFTTQSARKRKMFTHSISAVTFSQIQLMQIHASVVFEVALVLASSQTVLYTALPIEAILLVHPLVYLSPSRMEVPSLEKLFFFAPITDVSIFGAKGQKH